MGTLLDKMDEVLAVLHRIHHLMAAPSGTAAIPEPRTGAVVEPDFLVGRVASEDGPRWIVRTAPDDGHVPDEFRSLAEWADWIEGGCVLKRSGGTLTLRIDTGYEAWTPAQWAAIRACEAAGFEVMHGVVASGTVE